MRSLQEFVLSYLLSSIWQVPLFFGVGWLVSRALRGSRPTVIHRVWVVVLLLQTAYPAVAAARWPWRELLLHSAQQGAGERSGVTVTFGPAVLAGSLRLSSGVAGILTVAYGLWLLAMLTRLLWSWRRTLRLDRAARPLAMEPEVARVWDRVRTQFGCPNATLVVSAAVRTPFTMGVLRQRVVVPDGLLARLSDLDLLTLLAHECAHMRRNDFALNLLYEVVAVPVAYHPFLRLTRDRLVESREWVCDGQAAAAVGVPKLYARSLLRLATSLMEGMPVKTPHAIGMLDANALERRVMQLTQGTKVEGVLRRSVRLAGCGVLAVVTCGSAWAWRSGVVLPGAPQSAASAAPAPVRIASGLMAGQVASRVNPIYPPEAKKAHIQGAVVLQATISKSGAVEALTAVSGPPELQGAALDAVRQWTFMPFLLNGNPAEVATFIEVNFQLTE